VTVSDLRWTVLQRWREQPAQVEMSGRDGAPLTTVMPLSPARASSAVAMKGRDASAAIAFQPIACRASDGELAEVVLDRRPTVTARPSLEPDARIRASTAGISAILMGEPLDESIFTHVAGDRATTDQLIAAIS
jgi:hypothetical protein